MAEEVGKGLANGWQKGLAKGWRRVSGFPCILQFRNSRGARLETLVCDSMGGSSTDFVQFLLIWGVVNQNFADKHFMDIWASLSHKRKQAKYCFETTVSEERTH